MPSRREFLTHGLGAVASLSPLLAPAKRPKPSRKRLIVCFQRGGADGLSMVVPYAEPAYYRRRPTIAVPPPGHEGGAIDLDGFFGLHPSLAPLMALYDRRQLAIVHACGLPVPTRSHLAAQDAIESMLARLADAGACSQLTIVESRNWDYHAEQGGTKGQLAERLGELARTLVALTRDPGLDLESDVIVALSEFGRTIAENGDRGTDHGHGHAMLVIGGSLKGGHVHGMWPGLEPDQRELPVSTDVRDVLETIIAAPTGMHT